MLYIARMDDRGVQGIVRDFAVNERHLARYNDMSTLHVGSLVFVNIDEDRVHIVKPFETIEKIAALYHTTPEKIRKYNGIDRAFVGDKVFIANMDD